MNLFDEYGTVMGDSCFVIRGANRWAWTDELRKLRWNFLLAWRRRGNGSGIITFEETEECGVGENGDE